MVALAKNKAVEYKGSILKQLRNIANADTEEEYENEVHALKSSDFCRESVAFRNWIDKQWLCEKKRWVYCFRSNCVNIQVSTTNGVEAMNKKLKYQYLKNFNNGNSLSGLAKVLIEKFLPDCKNNYIRNNVVCLSTFKRYSSDIPLFLVERPKKFVSHCLKRSVNAKTIPKESIVQVDVGKFQVMSESTSGERHSVGLSTQIPFCTCADWKKFHLP